MAGTLTISTLSDGTNSTSSTNCIQGSAKAWVRYNAVSQTIAASYNISSVTRNGTGDFTVTFSNALADGNYAISFGNNDINGGNVSGGHVLSPTNIGTAPTTMTSTQCRFLITSGSGTNYDAYVTCATFFR